MSTEGRTIGTVLAWQIAASTIFYGMFASTQFLPGAFDVSRLFVGVAVTALMLGYTVCLFPVGALVDGYGERVVMIGGLFGLSMGALGTAVAQSYAGLLLAMFVLGCVYAGAMPATNRAIMTGIPVKRRSLAMGVKQVGVTAGSGIGALLVTWFATTRFSWRGGFVAASVVGFVIVAVFAAVYRGESGTGTVQLFSVDGIDAGATYRGLVAAGGFLGAGLFTATGYVTLYVNEQLGMSVAFAGVTLAVMQVGGSAGRVVTGKVADHLDETPVRSNALVLSVQAILAVVLLTAITAVTSRLAILVAFALLGFTLLGFTGVYYACLGALVPADDIGSATAGGQTALNAGALVAPPAFGLLADYVGYRASWLLLAACTFVAFCILVVYVLKIGDANSTPAETTQ